LNFGFLGGFRGRFRSGDIVKVLANFLRDGQINRTRVGLLLGDAELREQIDDCLGLDL
jgi:hypothetical protein